MSVDLRSVPVPSETDIQQRRRRRAHWLRLARNGMSQAGAAEMVGLSPKSASTISDWENAVADPSLLQLERLAGIYGVPLSLFTDPPETDEERLARIRRLAGEQEQRDSEEGEG